MLSVGNAEDDASARSRSTTVDAPNLPDSIAAAAETSDDVAHFLLEGVDSGSIRRNDQEASWLFIALALKRQDIGLNGSETTVWCVKDIRLTSVRSQDQTGIFMSGITFEEAMASPLRFLIQDKRPFATRINEYVLHSPFVSLADVIHRRHLFHIQIQIDDLSSTAQTEPVRKAEIEIGKRVEGGPQYQLVPLMSKTATALLHTAWHTRSSIGGQSGNRAEEAVDEDALDAFVKGRTYGMFIQPGLVARLSVYAPSPTMLPLHQRSASASCMAETRTLAKNHYNACCVVMGKRKAFQSSRVVGTSLPLELRGPANAAATADLLCEYEIATRQMRTASAQLALHLLAWIYGSREMFIDRPSNRFMSGDLPAELFAEIVMHMQTDSLVALAQCMPDAISRRQAALAAHSLQLQQSGRTTAEQQVKLRDYAVHCRREELRQLLTLSKGRQSVRSLYVQCRFTRNLIRADPNSVLPRLQICMPSYTNAAMEGALACGNSAHYKWGESRARSLLYPTPHCGPFESTSITCKHSNLVVISVTNWEEWNTRDQKLVEFGSQQKRGAEKWAQRVPLLIRLEMEMERGEQVDFVPLCTNVLRTAGCGLQLPSKAAQRLFASRVDAQYDSGNYATPCVWLNMRPGGVVQTNLIVNFASAAFRDVAGIKRGNGATGRFRLAVQYDEEHPEFPRALCNSALLRAHSHPFLVYTRSSRAKAAGGGTAASTPKRVPKRTRLQ
jgi:hypothetical protein